jgi:hypothetical protein
MASGMRSGIQASSVMGCSCKQAHLSVQYKAVSVQFQTAGYQ